MSNNPRMHLGRPVLFWMKGQWYAAIVCGLMPGTPNVHLTIFHPISGALPYQNVPPVDLKHTDNQRPNCWKFPEDVIDPKDDEEEDD